MHNHKLIKTLIKYLNDYCNTCDNSKVISHIQDTLDYIEALYFGITETVRHEKYLNGDYPKLDFNDAYHVLNN
jgi:hypothetical protein